MSNNVSSQRRMSVDVHPAAAYVARPPCSPITNETPVIRKKSSFSFANFIPKRESSRSASPSPTSSINKPKKPKKEAIDVVALYGADFARAVSANQFLNGGSTEDAISRVKRDNEKMARRRAEKMGVPYVPDSVAPVHGRNGELFRDAQEESERRGLVRNAYKGMPEPSARKPNVKGMRDEDEQYYSAEEDTAAAQWAKFQPSSASSRTRTSTASAPRRDGARGEFFAASFVPPVPARRS